MRSFWRTLTKPAYLPLADKAEERRALSRSSRALFLLFAGVMVVEHSAFCTCSTAHFWWHCPRTAAASPRASSAARALSTRFWPSPMPTATSRRWYTPASCAPRPRAATCPTWPQSYTVSHRRHGIHFYTAAGRHLPRRHARHGRRRALYRSKRYKTRRSRAPSAPTGTAWRSTRPTNTPCALR